MTTDPIDPINSARCSGVANRVTMFRLFARPGIRLIVLLLSVSVCSFGILSCQPAFIDRMYAVIQVSHSESGAPTEGAIVSARQVIFRPFPEESDYTNGIAFAPTDSDGRTWMHVFRAGNRPFEPIIELKVQTGESMDELSLLLAAGERASGDHFTATIAETDAAPPPPPLLTVVDGSKPPRILVRGYVRLIGVCSNSTRAVTWERILRSGQYYHEEITVGSTEDDPQGTDVDQMTDSDAMADTCPLSTAHVPSSGFVVYARPPIGNDYYQGEIFCLDENDRVVSCDADETP